ncbi:hypothetical protein V8F20_010898 [Naviculisporaceae sp. PSN 640]
MGSNARSSKRGRDMDDSFDEVDAQMLPPSAQPQSGDAASSLSGTKDSTQDGNQQPPRKRNRRSKRQPRNEGSPSDNKDEQCDYCLETGRPEFASEHLLHQCHWKKAAEAMNAYELAEGIHAQKHSEAIAALKSQHDAEIQTLNIQHKESLEELAVAHERQITRLKTKLAAKNEANTVNTKAFSHLEKKLKRRVKAHHNAMSMLREKYENRISKLNRTITHLETVAKSNARYEAELEDLEERMAEQEYEFEKRATQHGLEIEALKKHHQRDVQRLEEEEQRLIAEHEALLRDLKNDHRKKIDRLEQDIVSRTNVVNADFKLLQEHYGKEINQLKDDKEKLIAEHERKLEALERLHEREKERLYIECEKLSDQHAIELETVRFLSGERTMLMVKLEAAESDFNRLNEDHHRLQVDMETTIKELRNLHQEEISRLEDEHKKAIGMVCYEREDQEITFNLELARAQQKINKLEEMLAQAEEAAEKNGALDLTQKLTEAQEKNVHLAQDLNEAVQNINWLYKEKTQMREEKDAAVARLKVVMDGVQHRLGPGWEVDMMEEEREIRGRQTMLREKEVTDEEILARVGRMGDFFVPAFESESELSFSGEHTEAEMRERDTDIRRIAEKVAKDILSCSAQNPAAKPDAVDEDMDDALSETTEIDDNEEDDNRTINGEEIANELINNNEAPRDPWISDSVTVPLPGAWSEAPSFHNPLPPTITPPIFFEPPTLDERYNQAYDRPVPYDRPSAGHWRVVSDAPDSPLRAASLTNDEFPAIERVDTSGSNSTVDFEDGRGRKARDEEDATEGGEEGSAGYLGLSFPNIEPRTIRLSIL